MAIFGIFHAYSAGFMGMADARDRTVATNYMREIMEDIKNTDFEKIEEKAGTGTVTISGKTFTKVVTVEPSTNLKKVSTIIYWDNYTKSVKSDMLIHFMQTIAGNPSRIMLFANPYKLTPGSTSTLTAIVKDEKGSNVNSWSGDITFSITYTSGSDYGSFSTTPPLITTTVNTSNGQASVNYIAPESEVDIIIEASATGLSSDSVNITVTAGAVKIALSVPANDTILSPGDSTIITAKLVDADNVIPANITDVDVTFSVSGPGNLASPITRKTVDGAITIELSTSPTNPGTITVIASTADLNPGSISIITGGIIDITSTSNSIPIGESVDMTVTVKDLNGIPINYKGIIDLSSSGSEGVLGSFPNNPDNQIVYDGMTSSNVVSYAVNNSSSTGTVTITASEPDGILNSGTISYEIGEELIPDHIMVYAKPANMIADGISTSIITATVKTDNNRTVESYTCVLNFEMSDANLGSLNQESVTPNDGIATTELTSSTNRGMATINVTSMDIDNNNNIIEGFTTVGFYLYADDVDLVANPPSILEGGGLDGTTKITATIKDGEVTVSGYTGSVTFSILEGHPNGVVFTTTNKISLIVPVGNGEATVYLESKNWTGTAEIKAVASDGMSSDLINHIFIPVLSSAELNLVEGTIGYDSINNWVSFNIEVLGAAINLEEMQYSLLSSSVPEVSLNIITIDGTPVYNGTVGSDEIITIIVDSFILYPGTHTIVLDFYANVSISEQHLGVIFYPDSGNYPVDFTIPTAE
jgi:hypothetical protein